MNLRDISRKIFFFSLFLFHFTLLSAQQYFQQEVNHRIHVSLDDKKHELNAFQTVEYINNSPDTLHFLFFHLWPNAYSTNKTKLARQIFNEYGKKKLFKDPLARGYIDSLDFKVDNVRLRWSIEDQPDVCKIFLNEPLIPGDTIIITTPFHVKIPEGVSSRWGHIGQAYQISQWYPKPAVYDRRGWHPMSYLDQGEFYSEFGRYDISITLQADYIVGATGNLQNEPELELLDKLAADTALNFEKERFPVSTEQVKTLHYTGINIHDFAWFADKRFHVKKGKVKLPGSGREVTTWIMYTNQQAEHWKDAISYLNNAIEYFSRWNGDYPYNSFTAVQGSLGAGDGMEYPGLALIGTVDDPYSLEEVIVHEVCHSWFYSAVGSDERRYPFMDEGITSANEVRYMKQRYPQRKLWEEYIGNVKLAKFFHIDKMPADKIQEFKWLTVARNNLEKPVNLHSEDYTSGDYSLIVYDKAGKGFNYLRAYLGDVLYDSAMHEYYNKWKFRHPEPDDLRRVFESHTGKNLDWFFDEFISSTRRMDYKAVRFENQHLLIKNKGEMKSPVVIAGITRDSISFEKWVEGFEGEKWIELPPSNYSEIKIDPLHATPELFRLNNNIRRYGIFPKRDSLRTQLLFTLEDPGKRHLMYMPAVNWNKENGFMIGILLHNGFLIPKPVEYLIMPFYPFNNSGPVGFGKIAYNIIPYNFLIRKVVISVDAARFGAPGSQNYHRLKGGLDFYFKDGKWNNNISHKIYGNYTAASDLAGIIQEEKADIKSYLQFGYLAEKRGLLNPFNFSVYFESGPSFLKASLLYNYRLSYGGMKNGLEIRVFAGTMLKNNPDVPFYSFAAGGRSGRELYLYQGTYPDRFGIYSTSFWSKQVSFTEGGLASPVNEQLGYSQRVASLGLTASLPGKLSRIGIRPFATVLLNDHGTGTGSNSPLFYEAGLKAGFRNFFEIFFPLLVSPNIDRITGDMKDRIRILFSLDALYQVKLNSVGGIKLL